MGEAGTPDASLIIAVQEVVDANRPITADALVLSPDVVSVDMSLEIIPRSGYDIVTLEQEIRRRLSVYFGDIEDPELDIAQLGVGKDVVIAQIIGLVMMVSGVYSVNVLQPASDVVINPNEFPELGTVNITMEAASHE